jgi:hypothetical protein
MIHYNWIVGILQKIEKVEKQPESFMLFHNIFLLHVMY